MDREGLGSLCLVGGVSAVSSALIARLPGVSRRGACAADAYAYTLLAAAWSGVRLRDVLLAAGLDDEDPNVAHIQVGGWAV